MQFIAGEWVKGKDDSVNKDTSPFTGETLVEIQQATKISLMKLLAAQEAQKQWAQTLPAERTALLHKVIQLMDERREEILDWLIKESSSTRIKAGIELNVARTVTLKLPVISTASTARFVLATHQANKTMCCASPSVLSL